MIDLNRGQRLEQYTLRHPQEVLLIEVSTAGEVDEVMVFKGFSSSLMRPTASDLEVPVIPVEAEIEVVHRYQAPYNRANPQLLEGAIAWETFAARLESLGL
jgi:hypothetical protein